MEALTYRLVRFLLEHPEFSHRCLLRLLNSSRPEEDRFVQEFMSRMAAAARRESADSSIDAEPLAVAILGATLVWPLWARPEGKDGDEKEKLAQAFTREIMSMNLRGFVPCGAGGKNIRDDQ